MSHHLTNEQLSGHIHRTLNDAQREMMDHHLATCPSCRSRLIDNEALQRRVRYDLSTDLRTAQPSPQMSFKAIAPRLKRSRRFTMFVKQSTQLVYGATTLIVLVLLAMGLMTVLRGVKISPPGPVREISPSVQTDLRAPDNSSYLSPTSPAAPRIASAQHETVLEATRGYLNVGQLKVHYEMMGSGPTVVLIHDALLHREVWDEQFVAFAKDYTVIRYDRRGYGLSESNDMGYVNIEDLYALLKFLNIDSATLIGSSYGGRMVIDFTLAYPDMVDALVVVGAPISGSSFSQNDFSAYVWRQIVFNRYFGIYRPSGRLHSPDEAKEAIKIWMDLPSSNYWILQENSDARERARELLLANLQNLIHRRLIREPEPPANGRLADIQVPTLIIVGQGDNPDLHEHAHKLEMGVAGAEKVVIPNAGHLVHLEQPEAFNQAVLDFLRQQ